MTTATTLPEFRTTGTTTKTEYGKYQHGIPQRKSRGMVKRFDKYTPDDDSSPIGFDSVFVASVDDDSPIFSGRYNSRCNCCWLGFPHSEAKHNRALRAIND